MTELANSLAVGVGVGAFIVNQNHEVLLMKRASTIAVTRTTAGMWSVPGGQIDYGETAEQAVIREVLEEIGVEAKIKKFIGYSDQILNAAHWVSLHFLCDIGEQKPSILEPEKCTQLKWYSCYALPENAGITHVLRPAYLLGYLSDDEFENQRRRTSQS